MRRLLLLLAVTLVALVVADRGTERLVEQAIAAQLQSNADLPERPEVDVRGVPFLTQALSGVYRDVEVDIGTATAGASSRSLQVQQLRVQLAGVQVPLRAAISRSVERVPIEGGRADGLVPFATLVQAAGRPSLQLRAAGDKLSVRDTVTVLGQRLDVTALSRVELSDGRVTLTAEQFLIDGQPAPALVSNLIGTGQNLSIPVDQLPYGLSLTRLAVAEQGLLVSAESGPQILRP